jgi:uncharacterized repeat protein (TIGR03806 family)
VINKKNLINLFIAFGFITNALSQVNDSVILDTKVPKKLSEFNFFADLNLQEPNEGVLPYDLINPLFSDYADKLRFVYVPENKRLGYSPDKVLDFPDGSVLIKTFAYLNDHPESKIDKQLLETRLLIKKNDSWKNISYIWNEEQDDAYLSIAGKTINTAFVMEDGTERNVRYRVPNINQCKECHQLNKEIQPIGPKVRNLNQKISYSDGTMNQIKKWQLMEWIDSADNYQTMADWSNEKNDLESRARAYLDINCGHCHIPGGSADTTGLYLNLKEDSNMHIGIYKKPVAAGRASNNLKYSIDPGNPSKSIMSFRMTSLDPGIMMPESGRSLNHKEGVELIEKWIKNMK